MCELTENLVTGKFLSVYEIAYQDFKSWRFDLKNSITSKKRKLVHKMIDKIQLSQGVNSSKSHMTKMKNKRADCSTVVSAQPTLKRVRLGWLVKRGDRYEKMKKPLGGVKEVPLEVGNRYLVSDIKKNAREIFLQ
ncbi:uncharacterized protein LOC141534949 isoform X2 [Cotesia typhae]|uniref:uncharacterized protein LOC141534949 isoform X2 n=1 Tax=Cotesia typhae TaxID=2053667 RepID=UPI003D683719